jgi:hypothetical protein
MPDFPSLDHPALWRAPDLDRRGDWQIDLTDAEIAELTSAVPELGLASEDPDTTPANLPITGPRLRQIQHDLEHGTGATLIRGLDVTGWSEDRCRRLFWELSRHLGTPVSQSARGERIFSVRDAGFKDGDPRARGPNTRKKLTFHTDRCDVIGFLCLKQAIVGGENEVVSSMAIYEEIRRRRPDLLAVLMEPFHYLRHTVDGGNERPWCRQPIFAFEQGHFASAFLRVLIERAAASPDLPDLTPLQCEALDLVESVAAEPGMAVRFTQQPGDLLFLNNWVTYHRRTEFVDHTAPDERRHILRIWLAVPNSRPLAPAFLDNYGAIEAGAVRGGMKAA